VMLKLKQAQLARQKHVEAEQHLRLLEQKLAQMQSRMESAVTPEVQADEGNYITALLTMNSQVKTSASTSSQSQSKSESQSQTQEPQKSLEELNAMDSGPNRLFPLSGRARFQSEYQQAFPGLDQDVQPMNKLAKKSSASPTKVSLLQSQTAVKSSGNYRKAGAAVDAVDPVAAAAQRQQIQQALQILLQTRSKMQEESRQNRMKAELASLGPKQQDHVVRGELMNMLGELGSNTKQGPATPQVGPGGDGMTLDGTNEEDELAGGDATNLAEIGGGHLPGLGAIDMLAVSEGDTDVGDSQLTDLAAIAESLSQQTKKNEPHHKPTAAEQKAAQALKRTKELKYLEQELNLLDPQHKMGHGQ